MTIEDQLTVQRNWNLHLSNPNPDMTGLKDAYKSGEITIWERQDRSEWR